MDPSLLGLTTAFGLATAAGLNTLLPLLLVGLLARVGLLELASPYSSLAGDIALGGIAFLALLEIAGDKVPGLDSVVQTVQWPLAGAAGAILFASQSSAISWVSPELAILVGLLTSGAVHGVRTAARPAITVSTMGIANPVVSVIEDVVAVALVLASVLAPVLGVVILIAVAVAGVVLLRWTLKRGLPLVRWLRASR